MKLVTQSNIAPSSKKTVSLSILIADENEKSQLFLKFHLEAFCKKLTIATNAKTAHCYLQQYQFDLILLSIQSSYFDDSDLINIIKKPDAINKAVPVIAITTNLQDQQTESLIEAGFDDYLKRPIILKQLEQKLERWILKPKTCSVGASSFDYVSAMLEKTSGDKALAIILFNKLFSELQEQTQIIEQAIVSYDITLAEEVTHKLHGSVSFCGFSDIQALAKNLEISLSEKTFHLINANFLSLKNKILDFIQLKRSILKQLGTRI
jgi:CheY-like chemotaxis protein/HPt (histidine-containing phosphotransfer) domain-containing protein